ncbi:hypothetical protein ACLESD_10625 [Pyxidicoccus sp. 3LFB2]
MSVLALGAAMFPLTTNAADAEPEASTAGLCASASEEVSQDATQATQTEGTALRAGYCYFDCSRCETDQDCRNRGAGYCTSIPLCVQAPPAPSPQ